MVRQQKSELSLLENINQDLFANLLPDHVLPHYDNVPEDKIIDFYSQSYSNVAVASISVSDIPTTAYTDLPGQSKLGESIKLLNEVITAFDRVLQEPKFMSMDKLKSCGPHYIVVAGLKPNNKIEENKDNRKQHLTLLVEMLMKMKETLMQTARNKLIFRAGIDMGSVLTGVVGGKRPQFEIFGECVNAACKLDSTSLPGFIQMSEAVRQPLSDHYDFQCRGSIKLNSTKEKVAFLLLNKNRVGPSDATIIDDIDEYGFDRYIDENAHFHKFLSNNNDYNANNISGMNIINNMNNRNNNKNNISRSFSHSNNYYNNINNMNDVDVINFNNNTLDNTNNNKNNSFVKLPVNFQQLNRHQQQHQQHNQQLKQESSKQDSSQQLITQQQQQQQPQHQQQQFRAQPQQLLSQHQQQFKSQTHLQQQPQQPQQQQPPIRHSHIISNIKIINEFSKPTVNFKAINRIAESDFSTECEESFPASPWGQNNKNSSRNNDDFDVIDDVIIKGCNRNNDSVVNRMNVYDPNSSYESNINNNFGDNDVTNSLNNTNNNSNNSNSNKKLDDITRQISVIQQNERNQQQHQNKQQQQHQQLQQQIQQQVFVKATIIRQNSSVSSTSDLTNLSNGQRLSLDSSASSNVFQLNPSFNELQSAFRHSSAFASTTKEDYDKSSEAKNVESLAINHPYRSDYKQLIAFMSSNEKSSKSNFAYGSKILAKNDGDDKLLNSNDIDKKTNYIKNNLSDQNNNKKQPLTDEYYLHPSNKSHLNVKESQNMEATQLQSNKKHAHVNHKVSNSDDQNPISKTVSNKPPIKKIKTPSQVSNRNESGGNIISSNNPITTNTCTNNNNDNNSLNSGLSDIDGTSNLETSTEEDSLFEFEGGILYSKQLADRPTLPISANSTSHNQSSKMLHTSVRSVFANAPSVKSSAKTNNSTKLSFGAAKNQTHERKVRVNRNTHPDASNKMAGELFSRKEVMNNNNNQTKTNQTTSAFIPVRTTNSFSNKSKNNDKNISNNDILNNSHIDVDSLPASTGSASNDNTNNTNYKAFTKPHVMSHNTNNPSLAKSLLVSTVQSKMQTRTPQQSLKSTLPTSHTQPILGHTPNTSKLFNKLILPTSHGQRLHNKNLHHHYSRGLNHMDSVGSLARSKSLDRVAHLFHEGGNDSCSSLKNSSPKMLHRASNRRNIALLGEAGSSSGEYQNRFLGSSGSNNSGLLNVGKALNKRIRQKHKPLLLFSTSIVSDNLSLSSFNSEMSRSDPALSFESSSAIESEYDNYRPGMASDEDYFVVEPVSDVDIDLFDEININELEINEDDEDCENYSYESLMNLQQQQLQLQTQQQQQQNQTADI
ncbi:hypothetical protein HELRODRAFT_171005 [Helobdella robusta]|uniref:adenylate cyclase n=1 Tax=Helobdella robusta TaxID=6412 RepID=T1F3P4_HELRO|nr:hypothetical protein HELRODRAFT_171005 [Helobdella robusta]ESO06969.1 hypothetical protein HELRODRAFT_171005 [Helobdella robusta]